MSIQAVSNLKPIKVPNQSMALSSSDANSQIPSANNAPIVLEEKPKKKMPLKVDEWVNKFETDVKNKSDLNDTVNIPRTIFKGYLGFMAGTALGAVSNLIKVGEKGQHKKLKAFLGIASAITSLLGTWCFVRPYVIKDSQKKN